MQAHPDSFSSRVLTGLLPLQNWHEAGTSTQVPALCHTGKSQGKWVQGQITPRLEILAVRSICRSSTEEQIYAVSAANSPPLIFTVLPTQALFPHLTASSGWVLTASDTGLGQDDKSSGK